MERSLTVEQALAEFSKREVEFTTGLQFCKFGSINSIDGSPHITPTWFRYDAAANKLLITTAEDTVKARNVKKDPRVFVLLDKEYSYVSLNGRARINNERDGNEETERLAVMYLGEEEARKILPETLKVKHVVIEVTPVKVRSYNI